MNRLVLSVAASVLLIANESHSVEYKLNGHRFQLPAGFKIELVASTPLVDRPICADFDEQGRLYVADSSGSNDNVKKQLEERPHRIVRLEDTDGDGRYDESIVFADKMMFPEGAMWLEGSLYVAAPPSIWKLTDTDGDGKADRREEWFQGKTLTGCANDLHGPYRGPDGWIYWCKGAFAEQTYQRPGKEPFVTRAAHIFRRRPEGGPIEAVMTGGMDNPVEVVFTPGGERLFTTTFLQHPGGGNRDGIIHAVYGGVYGKRHSVIDGHSRTGDLMPVLVHLGAAAPCGLVRLESNELGNEYANNVLACAFNMRKITRQVLRPNGATFESSEQEFLSSDNLDFHPTDVLEDADGSLIVIDTGGWYKLCCPTSQLVKPDILGAIYRVRRTGGHKVTDPRGKHIAYKSLTLDQLVSLLGDSRHVVRRRSTDELVRRGDSAVAALSTCLKNSSNIDARREAVWTLGRIGSNLSQQTLRAALADKNEIVRQAAIHSVSVARDKEAIPQLIELLENPSRHNRRVAAEALGRIGDPQAVRSLLVAAGQSNDRTLEHSIIYALIEIGDLEHTAIGITSKNSHTRRAALIALDQIGDGSLPVNQVESLLKSSDPVLHQTGVWLLDRHPEWGPKLLDYYLGQIHSGLTKGGLKELETQLARLSSHRSIQELIAKSLRNQNVTKETKLALLRAMAVSGLKRLPDEWLAVIIQLSKLKDRETVQTAVSTARSLPAASQNQAKLNHTLQTIAHDSSLPVEVRIEALSAIRGEKKTLDPQLFELLLRHLPAENQVHSRALASRVIADSKLNSTQLDTLAETIVEVSPLDLDTLLVAFAGSSDKNLGRNLIVHLHHSPAISGFSTEKLRDRLSGFGEPLKEQIDELCNTIEEETRRRQSKFEKLLAAAKKGDVRRGQLVFNSSKAACFTCHAMGYLGGKIGPDLTRIGRIRSHRDLLEAVLFPSVSFVRSYEPVSVLTIDGKIISGLLKEQNGNEIVIQVDARKQSRIPREEVDEMKPGKVSIMPAGLDKQLSPQELADLLEFLKAAK